MDRAPRHHVMVDFQQHQQRLWVVLEEDHEKVEKRVRELEGLLREMLEAYDDGVGREDEHGNNWEFPLWQKVHAAIADQPPATIKDSLTAQPPAEHPLARRLREAGPQIAAEVDRMMGNAEACRECKGSRVQVAEHVLPCPACTAPATSAEAVEL